MNDGVDLLRTETERGKIQVCGFVVAIVLCVFFSITFVGLYVANSIGQCEVVLEDKINPNYACAASLVRLPNIGPARAAAMVAYREKLGVSCPDEIVFKDVQALREIKGIGPKTCEGIGPLLKFE